MDDKKINVDKLIGDIWNKKPSTEISGIYKYQDSHSIWFLNKYAGYVKYFEHAFEFYIEIISSLNYVKKNDWKWSQSLPYIYLGNSTYPMFKAYTLALEGFYEESITLSRVAFELLIKSIFCVCYPDDAFATFQKPEKIKRTFNLTNFIETDLKVDWKFLYALTSGTTHGKLYFARIGAQLQKKIPHDLIGLQLKADEKFASICINYSTFLLWGSIYFLNSYFDELTPDFNKNKEAKKEAEKYIVALGHIVKSTPNRFKKVGEEFEKVIKIINSVKFNQDWKKIT